MVTQDTQKYSRRDSKVLQGFTKQWSFVPRCNVVQVEKGSKHVLERHTTLILHFKDKCRDSCYCWTGIRSRSMKKPGVEKVDIFLHILPKENSQTNRHNLRRIVGIHLPLFWSYGVPVQDQDSDCSTYWQPSDLETSGESKIDFLSFQPDLPEFEIRDLVTQTIRFIIS